MAATAPPEEPSEDTSAAPASNETASTESGVTLGAENLGAMPETATPIGSESLEE